VIVAVADTHAVIWYLFQDKRLSETARVTIENAANEGNQIALSAITLAEIIYLNERDRIPADTLPRLTSALIARTSVLIDVSFDRNVAEAMRSVERSQVPELADRMIAATALYLNVPVITRDHKIQASNITTIW
jgi:PIN domain nuclease of toxin-antitoxin system